MTRNRFKHFKNQDVLPFVCGALMLCVAPAHASAPYSETPFAPVSLTGKSFSSLTTLALADANSFTQSVTRRQNHLHGHQGLGSSSVFFGEQPDQSIQNTVDKALEFLGKQFGMSDDDGGTGPQVWSSDFSSHGKVGNNYESYGYRLSGFSGGFDLRAGENWNFGFAGGYSRATSAFEAQGLTSTAVDAYHAAVYSSFMHESGSIDSNLSFSMFNNNSVRSLVSPTTSSLAAARGKGYQVTWSLSATGHGTSHGFALTPVAGVTYAVLHRSSMKEDGAGLYDLSSKAANSFSLKPMLGLDVAREFTVGSNLVLTPELYGIYRYEMQDAGETASTQFENLTANNLTQNSTQLSRHSLLLGGGLGIAMGDKFTGKLQFDSDLEPSSRTYRGVFKVGYQM